MNTLYSYKVVFAAMLFLQSCNFTDSTKQLGDGYFFRNEGDMIKDILSERPNGGEVPAKVIDFAYDQNFIIAKQKPKLPQDALYNKKHYYKKGPDAVYYWIVIKGVRSVLGPLDDDEYKEARKKYNVPDKLELE